jgi:hypothetical protein
MGQAVQQLRESSWKAQKGSDTAFSFFNVGLNKPRMTLILIAGYSSLCRLQRHTEAKGIELGRPRTPVDRSEVKALPDSGRPGT